MIYRCIIIVLHILDNVEINTTVIQIRHYCRLRRSTKLMLFEYDITYPCAAV